MSTGPTPVRESAEQRRAEAPKHALVLLRLSKQVRLKIPFLVDRVIEIPSLKDSARFVRDVALSMPTFVWEWTKLGAITVWEILKLVAHLVWGLIPIVVTLTVFVGRLCEFVLRLVLSIVGVIFRVKGLNSLANEGYPVVVSVPLAADRQASKAESQTSPPPTQTTSAPLMGHAPVETVASSRTPGDKFQRPRQRQRRRSAPGSSTSSSSDKDMSQPGLYLVTLTNEHPISVNANDPRIADRAIKVTRENCKFGKARNLAGRRGNYEKTFGSEYVTFLPIATLSDIDSAEKAILQRLDAYRIRGRTGRRNEWLAGIPPERVIEIAVETLSELDLQYELFNSATDAARRENRG